MRHLLSRPVSPLAGVGIIIAMVLAAAYLLPVGPGKTPAPSETPTPFQPVPPTATQRIVQTLAPSFTPEPQSEQVWHYLFLGVDKGPGRPKPVPGGSGDKTDVMLLVTVRDRSLMYVTITQLPRNLWVPQYPVDLLFEVYRTHGFDGTRDYFLEVFGIELNGIAAVDMTTFVQYVDELGGVTIGPEAIGCGGGIPEPTGQCHYDGASLLAWLRDNDNNWAHGVYDAGMRQHRALVAILDVLWHKMGAFDPLVTWRAFSKVETDISFLEWVDVATIALRGVHYGMVVDYERLAAPIIERDEIPIPPYRAEVAASDLKTWAAWLVGRD